MFSTFVHDKAVHTSYDETKPFYGMDLFINLHLDNGN